jgi:hypothetical protein
VNDYIKPRISAQTKFGEAKNRFTLFRMRLVSSRILIQKPFHTFWDALGLWRQSHSQALVFALAAFFNQILPKLCYG